MKTRFLKMNSERTLEMLNLLELEQLVAFADWGRLSKAAENLNISQPTITRTMQHLEYSFGVSLFSRSKNHIALNETGWKAVEYARQLLKMRASPFMVSPSCPIFCISGYDSVLFY